ncbi:MAG TPA: 50S ribosomal protein L10 [Solirubrobacteraceae bacterium]
MNRDQKAAAIAEIASQIDESDAIFAVDYRGITVAQVAELRATLRESDATFKVVKNSLTERAADQVGAESLKDFLAGPTALTFVRGDIATAAKVVADYARTTQLLPFKGGLMEGNTIDVEQIRSLSKLPSREVLYGQLVGVVASPIGGLVRSLNALISGLAVALGQVNAKKESGEIPAGAAPAAAAAEPEPAAEAEAPAAEEEALPDEIALAEDTAEAPPEYTTASSPEGEPEADEPAQADDNQADVSAENQSEDAETTKED